MTSQIQNTRKMQLPDRIILSECEKNAPVEELNMMFLRTDGFVRNIRSRNPFDVIRADVVLARMEKQANKACGLYYEIYEARLLSMAMNYLSELPLKDRPVFIGAAAKRGYMLTLAEAERAGDECAELMAEIANDY